MQNVNYNLLMQEELNNIKALNHRPSLLLHSCCAPCSTACIERLNNVFDLTVYYYNPNINTEEEYNLRLNEQIKLCNELGVKIIAEPYCKSDFINIVTGLENEKEGGLRCNACFGLRLEKTATRAKQNGIEYFATTLTVSPLKNASVINKTGLNLAYKIGVKYLCSDFKKQGGYLRSIELSRAYNLYRQNYCGCEFSKR